MITEKMQIARYNGSARAWGKVGKIKWEVESFEWGSLRVQTSRGDGWGWEYGIPYGATEELKEEIEKACELIRWPKEKIVKLGKYVGGCAPYVGPAFVGRKRGKK